jgi:hypothetical protein
VLVRARSVPLAASTVVDAVTETVAAADVLDA